MLNQELLNLLSVYAEKCDCGSNDDIEEALGNIEDFLSPTFEVKNRVVADYLASKSIMQFEAPKEDNGWHESQRYRVHKKRANDLIYYVSPVLEELNNVE